MTLRPRTPARTRRSPADAEDRFQFWVTIGFVAIIVAVIVILVAAVGVNYYNAHFRPVATVEGIDITQDHWLHRTRLTVYRIARAERQVREQLSAGLIDQETATGRISSLQQAEEQATQRAIEDLIDLLFQERLAQAKGITVTEADIDAAIQREASTPERRQVQVVFVEPETEDPDGVPTEEEDAAAREKAETALAALEDGFPFAQVAQLYSTDISRENGGEYGFISDDNPTDEAWVDAVFELEQGGTTEIVKGEDGVYRIGRVTRILQPTTDQTYVAELEDFVPPDFYRENVRREELSTQLRDQVTEEAVAGDIEQLHLAEILLEGGELEDEASGEGEIMASHILYSPNDEPAAASPLPSDDPAWAAAEEEAEAAAERLRAIEDPTEREEAFAETARTESDDQGSSENGGDLGWFPRTGQYVNELTDPLFDDEELVRGDVVGPLRSEFGYHLVLFVDRRDPIADRLQEVQDRLAEPDADFAAIAQELSDGDEAADGGDLGWLVRDEIPAEAQEAVLALEPGETTEPLFSEPGYHFYHLIEREDRPLDDRQRQLVRQSAFIDWYTEQKTLAQDEGRITRNPEIFTQAADDALDQLP